MVGMNWIFYLGRWYRLSPVLISGDYKLSIPGERGVIIVTRKELERNTRAFFGLKISAHRFMKR